VRNKTGMEYSGFIAHSFKLFENIYFCNKVDAIRKYTSINSLLRSTYR